MHKDLPLWPRIVSWSRTYDRPLVVYGSFGSDILSLRLVIRRWETEVPHNFSFSFGFVRAMDLHPLAFE